MVVSTPCDNPYNDFSSVDTATKIITDHLVTAAPDLWKLLYYTDPNVYPLNQPDLTTSQIAKMIVSTPQEMTDPDISANKNFLFQIDNSEALSAAVPQVRLELGDIIAIDSYRGYVNIVFQIVIPNRQRLFLAEYNPVADRRVAIVRELTKALNEVVIPNSNFYSKLFMNKSARDGAGRSTGATARTFNKDFSGYYLVFTALL